MSQNAVATKMAVIEWRVAPGHQADAQKAEDLDWTEHSQWQAEPPAAAEARAAFLQDHQSEPGLFEFRVKPV